MSNGVIVTQGYLRVDFKIKRLTDWIWGFKHWANDAKTTPIGDFSTRRYVMRIVDSNKKLLYELDSDGAAGIVKSADNIVTLTLDAASNTKAAGRYLYDLRSISASGVVINHYSGYVVIEDTAF